MKRKVAAMGRCCREFSWSMSVEPGERCLPKHRRESVDEPMRLDVRKPPDFVPDGSVKNRAEQIPCFFRTRKKRTDRCCR